MRLEILNLVNFVDFLGVLPFCREMEQERKRVYYFFHFYALYVCIMEVIKYRLDRFLVKGTFIKWRVSKNVKLVSKMMGGDGGGRNLRDFVRDLDDHVEYY